MRTLATRIVHYILALSHWSRVVENILNPTFSYPFISSNPLPITFVLKGKQRTSLKSLFHNLVIDEHLHSNPETSTNTVCHCVQFLYKLVSKIMQVKKFVLTWLPFPMQYCCDSYVLFECNKVNWYKYIIRLVYSWSGQ